MINKSIKTRIEFEAVVSLAQETKQWNEIVHAAISKLCESREEKVAKQI